jgi:ABC-type uncharacterized transport system ATPase subunit
MSDLLMWLTESHDVSDLTIEESEIDDIIKKIYEDGEVLV